MAGDKLSGWDVLAMWGGALPGVHGFGVEVSRGVVQRLLGFWMLWHMFGGLRGGIEAGVFSQSSAYRQRDEFARVFGVDVDDFNVQLAEAIASAVKK